MVPAVAMLAVCAELSFTYAYLNIKRAAMVDLNRLGAGVSERSKWNVASGLAVFSVLGYIGVLGYAFAFGKIEFIAFRDAALPVVSALLGYWARMLNEKE